VRDGRVRINKYIRNVVVVTRFHMTWEGMIIKVLQRVYMTPEM